MPAEGAGLLDNASELSYSDDKLSLSSASTTGGDAATALLRAAFMKDEYRGGWTGCLPALLLPVRHAAFSVLYASGLPARDAHSCCPRLLPLLPLQVTT